MSFCARGVNLTRYAMLFSHVFVELFQGYRFSALGLGHSFLKGGHCLKVFRHL